MNDLPYILASQLGTMREMQIQHREQQRRAEMQNMQRAVSTVYMGGGAGAYLPELERVPEHVDQAQAFVARQLVAQAQSDYRAAVERGKTAEAEAARVRMEVAVALEEANAQRARADKAEAALDKLQPKLRRELISPLFDRGPGSHELKWPWLAASWALVIAGVVVCAL